MGCAEQRAAGIFDKLCSDALHGLLKWLDGVLEVYSESSTSGG